ncbi:ribonuclease H2 subunit A [Tanacetum coccineum]|uniref:Ribonuclease n=1 Tax=Tanacetum coccineum TaxID=301880 RepID=A0ABQ4X7A5_9ASTR
MPITGVHVGIRKLMLGVVNALQEKEGLADIVYDDPSHSDSKTLKEEKREELFESLNLDEKTGWATDVIDPRELSSKMLQKSKINLNKISHESAMGLVKKVLDLGYLLTEVYVDTVGDPKKYRIKLSKRFPSLSSYPNTIAWLDHHKHSVFGFPSLVRFSWGTCNSYFKGGVEVLWEAKKEDDESLTKGKRQGKLTNMGFSGMNRSEDIESSGKEHYSSLLIS